MYPDRQTIVIVDDDADVGGALKRALETYGYHIELFGSPAECLNAIVARVAVCFVIDVYLGDKSGIDLAIHLSAIGIKTPIIHMSGEGTEAVRREALASGSIAFLDKPFGIPELVSTIERVTGRISVP